MQAHFDQDHEAYVRKVFGGLRGTRQETLCHVPSRIRSPGQALKQPDLLLIAALVIVGVFTEEQAGVLTQHYRFKPDYDNPSPIDLPTALDQVCVLFEMADDDAEIRGMIERGEICDDCGEPIEDHRGPTRARAAAPALPAPQAC